MIKIIIYLIITISAIILLICFILSKNTRFQYSNNYKGNSSTRVKNIQNKTSKKSSKFNENYRFEEGFYKDYNSDRHPSYQVLVNPPKKTWVRFKMTHEKSSKNRLAYSNPDPSNPKKASYINKSPSESRIFTRGKQYKDWKLDPRDKAIIDKRTKEFLEEKYK